LSEQLGRHALQLGNRLEGLDEATHRGLGETGTDLANAWLAMGDSGVDDGRNAGFHDLADVYAEGRTAEIEVGNLEGFVLACRDLLDNRWCTGHGE
jgi:hypothetical protein